MASKVKWPETPPLAEVQWQDAQGKHGWTNTLAGSGAKCTSVGYLIKDDEEGVTLAESLDHDPEGTAKYGCSTFIPRATILAKRGLK